MVFEKYPKLLLATSKASDGNMSFLKGSPDEALKNRQKFLTLLEINSRNIVVMNPPHGTEIVLVGDKDLGKGATEVKTALTVDGLITNQKELFLFLVTADCLPISIYDPQEQAIGLIHAGWLGLDNGIITKAIKAMIRNFNSQVENLIFEIGPSLGPCCNKGRTELKQLGDTKWDKSISQDKDKTYIIDLWSFAENELIKLGVKQENIHNLKICTYHSGQYFSNRKFNSEELKDDFRFATVFGMKEN